MGTLLGGKSRKVKRKRFTSGNSKSRRNDRRIGARRLLQKPEAGELRYKKWILHPRVEETSWEEWESREENTKCLPFSSLSRSGRKLLQILYSRLTRSVFRPLFLSSFIRATELLPKKRLETMPVCRNLSAQTVFLENWIDSGEWGKVVSRNSVFSSPRRFELNFVQRLIPIKNWLEEKRIYYIWKGVAENRRSRRRLF